MKDNHPIKTIFAFLAPYKKSFFFAIAMSCLTVLCLSIAPRIEGSITTIIFEDVKNAKDVIVINMEAVAKTLAILIGISITKTITQILTAISLTKSIQYAMRDLRGALQKKITKLPVVYFDQRIQGDVLSVITNDVDAISNALQQTLLQIISGVLYIIMAIVMMMSLKVSMAFIALLMIPGMLTITLIIVRVSSPLFEAQQSAIGALNGGINELYSGYQEIILYNQQQRAQKQFEQLNDDLRVKAQKAQFLSSTIQPLNSLVTYLIIASEVSLGSILAIQSQFDPGRLQAFVRYIWQLNDPLSQVSSLSTQIQSAYAASKRISDLLNEKEEIDEGKIIINEDSIKGNVCFDHVSFAYEKPMIINDFNLNIKAGDMVAIVGPTGAGKTTMMNLLMRFYDVLKGSITIDGIDIRDMKRADLRSLFAIVLQDGWLFHGSIMDNLLYGKLDASKEEVIEACKKANVHHFIQTLSQGYDTILNEEVSNISQGEKQLLTIARALLRNPKILILDEATSSVDTRLEKMLQDAMHEVMKNRTSFVIAHRLSTIRSADTIIVMNHGEIVESGNHDELMQAKGFYYRLYQAQFQE